MSNTLGGITNASIRNTAGSRSFSKAGLGIDANTADVQTASAVVHTIDGEFQTDLAVKAAIDLSAASYISGRDGEAVSGPVTKPAIPADEKARTVTYVMACQGDAVFVVEADVESDAARGSYIDYSLNCPDGYAPFGVIKIVMAPGSAAFTLGTTALTGVANQTVTFHDVSVCPASADNL